MKWLLPIPIALLGLALPAAAQTMLDQERRLVDIHSLLVDVPPAQAPGALGPGQVSVALEVVTIPRIDGTTGGKEQITASDRTRVFPRPRIAVGLPLTTGLRAFAGGSYIPPLRIRGVATHDLTLEAGVAWVPGTFRAGLRLHGVLARSTSPVTDPATRDVLTTREAGADLSAGVRLELAPGLSLEPYAGAGLVALHGHFRVTSDGNVVESDHTGPALHAGARLLARERWEAVVELAAYPGRLVHPGLRLGYVFP